MLYWIAATPAAPALTAVLAAVDHSHRVTLQQTDRGMEVRLRHDCLNAGTHPHGLMAWVITLMADPSTAAQPDHVIQFGATETPRQTASTAIDSKWKFPVLGQGFPGADVPFTATRLNFSLSALPRPPIAACGLPPSLRSTILVI